MQTPPPVRDVSLTNVEKKLSTLPKINTANFETTKTRILNLSQAIIDLAIYSGLNGVISNFTIEKISTYEMFKIIKEIYITQIKDSNVSLIIKNNDLRYIQNTND